MDSAGNRARACTRAPWTEGSNAPTRGSSAPLPDGGRLELWRDMARSVEAIRKLSPRDAAKWPAFCERMARLARLLESVYTAPPPDFMSRSIGDLARLAVLGLRVRRPRPAGDRRSAAPRCRCRRRIFWTTTSRCDALKGMLGAAGVMHLCQGPRSGGTAFRLLHHHVGSPPGVFRPPSLEHTARAERPARHRNTPRRRHQP